MNMAATQALIRFGLGAGPNDVAESDPRGALKAQLDGPDPGQASGAFDGLPTGRDGVDDIKAEAQARKAILAAGLQLAGNFKPKPLYQNDVAAQLGWAATTQAGYRERLVWFWANHFSVSISQGQTGGLVGPMIREAIRPHVNGNFTDMVLAVERHPAMLRYLMNDNSIGPNSPAGQRTGRGLNENLGRECMELHTVGLQAGYSQTDVTNMAKLLTGWSVAGTPPANKPRQGGDATGFKYQPNFHEPGPQVVLGQSFDGGESAAADALTFLSRYPTTYHLLAKKLVTHFVADRPPPAAVARIAKVLRETGGDLAAASLALVDLPEAWTPLTKLKTPLDYVISAVRAAPPAPGDKPPNYPGILNQLGQPVWGAPLPNGWPDQAAVWAGSDAIIARIDWAFSYAGRFDHGDAGLQPADVAAAALGPLLRPATADAIAGAGSRREALTLLFASPEFQRR
jgi:uncharacterized protein (DUF1800 family)